MPGVLEVQRKRVKEGMEAFMRSLEVMRSRQRAQAGRAATVA
jgi:hypothetical protein